MNPDLTYLYNFTQIACFELKDIQKKMFKKIKYKNKTKKKRKIKKNKTQKKRV